MRTWTAESAAPATIAWTLMVRPSTWSAWAPHVRGAWGLGTPEVRAGAVGAARLFGVIPVPAKITEKSERSWTWRVGPALMTHRVSARGDGSEVAVDLSAPGPLESALAAAYGPVIQTMLNRLARLAE
jgi:hypothetical protein